VKAQPSTATRSAILAQVLGGIERNRTPGYHFAGNFLALSFDRVEPADTRVSLQGGAHCTSDDGQTDMSSLFVLADIALACAVRAQLQDSVRLATVSLQLQFTGASRGPRLQARSSFQGYFQDSAGRQGLSRISLLSAGEEVCFGTGAFMVLAPPKGFKLPPLVPQRAQRPRITPADLTADELPILRRAEAALELARAPGESFIGNFWGYRERENRNGVSATLKNGQHVGNRVGHVQGGISLGLAESAARAALPAGWRPSAISACYLTPGEGPTLTARAVVSHRGRRTAVVRGIISGAGRRRVLETLMTYVAPA